MFKMKINQILAIVFFAALFTACDEDEVIQ